MRHASDTSYKKMKITDVISHVLQCDMEQELGYSQAYYKKRTAHLIEVRTSEGITGWGECFGPGNIALVNKAIINKIIKPIVVNKDPVQREDIWHSVYNATRDHAQKGVVIQALSGVDIALWDILGKVAGLPVHKLIGGPTRKKVAVYGYGMMLKRESVKKHTERFKREAKKIKSMGFVATKMKIGLGAKEDVKLVEAVKKGVGKFPFMVDANHCYDVNDAMYVGHALDEMGATWFEEPVAPEDHEGYKSLRRTLKTPVAGGEAEYTRWGFRELITKGCVDILQPEVCALGGISEYLKVAAIASAHFVPVVNHVWGSAIAVATNIQLLAAMPPMPGGLFPNEPWLEFDTTKNIFRDELLRTPLNIQKQVKKNNGYVAVPDKPGLGVEPNPKFIKKYEIKE